MSLLIRWLVAAIALFTTVKIGHAIGLKMNITLGVAPFIAVLVLAVVNALLRPILKLLTLPLGCLTFGLIGFFINALMFWIASAAVDGFEVNGVVPALFGSIAMGIVSGVLNMFVRKRE